MRSAPHRGRSRQIVTLVLFDIDGTLISAYGAGRRSLEEAFAEVFGKPDAAGQLASEWFAGKNDMGIFQDLAFASGIPSWEYERRYAMLESVYLRRLKENLERWENRRILPGVQELLVHLSERRARPNEPRLDLGLVTGNLESGARIKLRAFQLDRFFEAGGFGSDSLDRTEIATIARLRFERRRGASIPPSEIVLIGDTVHDVAAATACGYHAVAVATGTTSASDLAESGPELLLQDLSDPAVLLDLLAGGTTGPDTPGTS